MKSLVVLCGAVVVATTAVLGLWQRDAGGASASVWGGPVRTWHFPVAGPNRLELADRQVGVGHYVDDTKVVTFRDVNGNDEITHSSKWHVADVAAVGAPRLAKVVRISLKGIITKGQSDGLATVYVLIRPYGSRCCQGPPGFEDYPVDFQLADGRQVESVLQTVLQHAVDGRREWVTVDVPLVKGRFEWAWGYRRVGGDWPAGDGVAFEMFANAYGV